MSPPWQACGAEQDILRSCYRSVMAPYPDRPDILVPGRWYWCPNDARPLGFAHVFESRQWDPSNPVPEEPAVGEQPPRGAWFKGGNGEGVDGHAHGTRDEWMGVTPYTPDTIGRVYAGCNVPRPAIVVRPFGPCPDAPARVRFVFPIDPGACFSGYTVEADYSLDDLGRPQYAVLGPPTVCGGGATFVRIYESAPDLIILELACNNFASTNVGSVTVQSCTPFLATGDGPVVALGNICGDVLIAGLVIFPVP